MPATTTTDSVALKCDVQKTIKSKGFFAPWTKSLASRKINKSNKEPYERLWINKRYLLCDGWSTTWMCVSFVRGNEVLGIQYKWSNWRWKCCPTRNACLGFCEWGDVY